MYVSLSQSSLVDGILKSSKNPVQKSNRAHSRHIALCYMYMTVELCEISTLNVSLHTKLLLTPKVTFTMAYLLTLKCKEPGLCYLQINGLLINLCTKGYMLRRLDGQRINHYIYRQFLEIINISYNKLLFSREKF